MKEYNETSKYVDILNKEIYELQNENLKQQLAEKDKEIERLTSSCEYFINHNNHIVRKLPLGEEEIILAPKQICDLLNGYSHEFMDCQERIAQIRHQVCEEIKKYILKNWDWFKDLWLINGKCEELEQVLDQIEKEKEKQNDV